MVPQMFYPAGNRDCKSGGPAQEGQEGGQGQVQGGAQRGGGGRHTVCGSQLKGLCHEMNIFFGRIIIIDGYFLYVR